ncbi:hsdS type I restriction-modification enzyme, S subunit [Pyrococcus abyssi GE5]|uniref:Type I restriction-modification enzyme, S subunit n=1 Tax=Pyrococcus abyssi (strain GE5 / Orsay) TaxID=272844 RepID=Q9V1X9_PYRAB|nr:hsdS type I restriction-modification enzyme, S subunit [Pyrococcus abyssi GE5]CCE69673.1 TPA: type I restriction-modification enzyme, S subunit [Pyrococcus abyssi GE5]
MSEASFTFYRETRFKEVELNGRKARIPEEWEVVELGEVARIRKKKSVRDIAEVAVIPMEKVPQDNELFAEFEIKAIEDVKSSTYCEAGDLLLAKITPSFENGKQGIVPFNVPNGFALATTEVYPIVPSENLDVFFLFYILKDKRFRKILEVRMTGTTGRQRVQKTDLLKLQIPLPPLEEQKKIAEILRSIDEAIQAVDESIARLERLKKGTMERLLTRGINHTRFKTVELNGRKVEIPEEWDVVELGEVAERRNESVNPANMGNIPFVGLEHIEPGNIRLSQWGNSSEVKSSKSKFYPGDILYGKLRPYLDKAVIADFEGICSTDIIVIKAKEDKTIPEYLIWVIHSKEFIEYAKKTMKGVNHPRTSWKSIKQFQIPLPPLEEQKKIAEILRTIDEAIEAKRAKKEKLERMKKAVMEKLLTGEVRVR